MKGTLHKTEEGWMVSHATYDSILKKWTAGKYTLHPLDVKQIEKDAQVFDNIEARIAAYPDVEFEIVKENVDTGALEAPYIKVMYAKLINQKKDDVEKLADDYVSDVYEMAQVYAIESGSKNRESRRKGFVDGYLKAKENTYTEEQVREAIEIVEPKELREYIIQSLKQPK